MSRLLCIKASLCKSPCVYVHHVHASVSLPPKRALPKLFPTVSLPSTLSSLKCHSLSTAWGELISHGSPSVHPVVAEVSLPPNGALPKLFPAVSRPSTLSSLMSFPPRQSKLYKREPKHRRYFWETRWAREPKSKKAHSTPFLKNLVVWAAVLCTKTT